ncbi:CBS domain-containing protein [Actinomadura sp. DC4]|uniref:CBS domain-containing protein n=1 Tax=Actinomadura sp. DC4 TaxID=3055069 RepID=UPI0025AF9C62|nr:CBS domain-containing protein [Actinomadura sp. DC4]MDN3357971.1 CBS domain-containing protein [Actinomadura sp. DC4]
MTSSFEENLVSDVMSTDVLTVAAEETTLMAWELMRQGGFHHVPVVGTDGHCIGVLDAETMAAAWDGGGPDRMRMPVSTVVDRRPPPCVTVADSVAATARAMLAAQLDFVAVTGHDGRLVGLVTARDLVAAVAGLRHHAAEGRAAQPALYRIEPVLPG